MKPKMALISTWQELCGIAHYAEHLKKALDNDFDVTVFPVPRSVFSIQSPSKIELKIQEDRIDAICAKLRDFDFVNIHFEPVLYGTVPSSIISAFNKIVSASDKVIVTFHSVVKYKSVSLRTVLKHLRHMRLMSLLMEMRNPWKPVWDNVFLTIKKNSGKVVCIAHTQKDKKYLETYVTPRTFDTPLVYKSKSDRENIASLGEKSNLSELIVNDPSVRYIGVFGFITDYKNYLSAFKALRELPDNYHLIVCGSLHEGQMYTGMRSHKFVDELIDYVSEMDSQDKQGKKDRQPAQKSGTAQTDGQGESNNESLKRIFSKRVHFVGSLSDDDMLCGMMMCDAVIFPYWNWHNTASGPLSLSIELDRFSIATRTSAFYELEKYYPQKFEFVDIGNYYGIAEQVLRATRTVKEEKMVNGMRWVYFAERPGSIYPDRTLAAYKKAAEALKGK